MLNRAQCNPKAVDQITSYFLNETSPDELLPIGEFELSIEETVFDVVIEMGKVTIDFTGYAGYSHAPMIMEAIFSIIIISEIVVNDTTITYHEFIKPQLGIKGCLSAAVTGGIIGACVLSYLHLSVGEK
jgi:hypothetical protein